MRQRTALLAGLSIASLALASCNLVFGIQPGELTGGAAGAGGNGGNGGNAGEGGQGATTTTTTTTTTSTTSAGGGGGTAGSGGQGGSCTAGTATCDGPVLHACNPEGVPLADRRCDVAAACDAAAAACIDASSLGRIAVGASRGCAIEDDRKVRCWGLNGAGVDILGSQDDLLSAAEVPAVSGVRQVTLDETQVCALSDDGSVKCWGFNNSGEVSFPAGNPEEPKKVSGVAGAVELSAGYRCTCARLATGAVSCWGERNTGCLGPADGTSITEPPTPVDGVEGAVQLQAGSYFAPWCARVASGQVLCWSWWSEPAVIPGVDDAIDVATGTGHVFILSASKGLLWTSSSAAEPAWLSAEPYADGPFTAIEAGESFCGLRDDGAILCAPLSEGGDPELPVEVPDLPAGTVAEIAVGRSFVYDRELACLRLSGQPLSSAVYCWGDDFGGGLGAGGPDLFPEPQPVSGLPAATSVVASQHSTAAVLADGSLRLWGTSRGLVSGVAATPQSLGFLGTGNAQLRTNDTYNSAYSVKTTGALQYRENGSLVPGGRLAGAGITDFADVLHFHRWDIARRAGGEVVVYTLDSLSNVGGIRGDGTTVAVADETAPVPGLATVQAIAAYGPDDAATPSHACALLAGGSLVCWGDNYSGQIGNGEVSDMPVTTPAPVAFPGGEAVVSVAAGRQLTCAVVASGKVYCWGENNSGQLGVAGVSDHPEPLEVLGVTGAVGVTAREAHVCAWLADETVSCWGENGGGQLGTGTFDDQDMPVPVPALADVVEVSAGVDHTCARHGDGSLSCWGSSYRGQIGNGVSGQFDSPQMVLGL